MGFPVFVGELNPYGANPHFALYCLPATSAGGRLQRLVCGLHRTTYLACLRHNLCDGRWSAPAARDRANALLAELAADGTPSPLPGFVLLGRKVASAFGLGDIPPFTGAFRGVPGRTEPGAVACIVLPHPSGLCRVWNEPDAFDRARTLLRSTWPTVPWGELSGGEA